MFFFHQREFVYRSHDREIITFSEGTASICFTKTGTRLTSLDRSPFGGFSFSGHVNEGDIERLLNKVTNWSATHNISSVVIRNMPDVYDPDNISLIHDQLTKSEFNVMYQDVAQYLPVKPGTLPPINVLRRRMVNRALEMGYRFEQLPARLLPAAYPLFIESRENKGYPVTMSLTELTEAFRSFPERYTLFGVFDGEVLIAVAVTIRVNEQILYYFYVGDRFSYRASSPVTFLIKGIYEFCAQHNFSILDLGISTDKGLLNEGLYQFKRSFGCLDSLKLTYERKL